MVRGDRLGGGHGAAIHWLRPPRALLTGANDRCVVGAEAGAAAASYTDAHPFPPPFSFSFACAGQRVIVFANLQARKLAGFPSNGMVLCATAADGRVEFVEPPAAAAIGERVVFPGHEGKAASPNQMAKKKVFELVAPDLAVSDDCVATWKGVPFMTSAGPCIVKTAKNGPIK